MDFIVFSLKAYDIKILKLRNYLSIFKALYLYNIWYLIYLMNLVAKLTDGFGSEYKKSEWDLDLTINTISKTYYL